jgi:hypothetical protein
MNAWEIAKALMLERHSRNFCLPNYTPRKWWECDVFEVTESGYFREYEIKISRSDFRADKDKIKSRWDGHLGIFGESVTTVKQQEIGKTHGPRQFWYVCPEGLIKVEEVPQWAGLIHMMRNSSSRLSEWEIKRAPNLHSEKFDEKRMLHAKGICYWRLHTQFSRGIQHLPCEDEHDWSI